ncbi:MAG: SpoIIE family protein phosphatase [Deltaproteobacteria bacterium]|nr:SpoIIE family protein phosphatase [Deltaproteobacteria bacterium]
MLDWFRSSIQAKVMMVVLLATTLVLAFVLGVTGIFSRSFIVLDAESDALRVASMVGGRIANELSSIAMATRNLAYSLETGNWDRKSIDNLLIAVVQRNRDIFGSTVSFAPFEFDPTIKAYAPYFYKGRNGLVSVQLADSYDYFERDWFRKPFEEKSPVWSAPYFDEGGGETLMITYSCPFFGQGAGGEPDTVRGVITADVSLDRLTEMVSEIKLEKTGYAFLLSNKGVLMVWPQKELIMRETIFSLAEGGKDPHLKTIAFEIMNQEKGFHNAGESLNGKDSFLAFASLPTFGWRLGVVIPKDELFAQTYLLERILFIIGFAGIVLLLTSSLIVARSVTAPLKRMVSVTSKIGEGNFDVDFVEKNRLDEVGQLSRAFESMVNSLKKYMKDLTQATARKERIESELRIAADIQKSMLRTSFPAFPDRDDFDIYAMMRPAKEVGGDFFDFFLLDSEHLCISVGDVSGKGTPAALFMAVTKYLIEASVGVETPIDKTLEKVNALLFKNNDSCMFVTVFLGILNLKTGELIYANAGHNSPLIWTENKEVQLLEAVGGPILGIFDPADFRTGTTTLNPQGHLLVYTDGVTEAFNSEGREFSEEKLMEIVRLIGRQDAKSITEMVLEQIDQFRNDVEQSDDITIMVLNYTPRT